MDLFRAVKISVVDKVQKILTYVPPDVMNEAGETPLALACRQFHPGISLKLKVIELLLEHGALVNRIVGNSQSTSLHYAVQSQQLEVVELLLERGALVNVANRDNITPLHEACRVLTGRNKIISLNIVHLLLQHQANVNAESKERKTPLMFALGQGNEHLVQMLLDNGAYVDGTDDKGVTPLMLACSNCSLETVKLILRLKPPVSGKDSLKSTVLHYLARTKYPNDADVVAKYLIELGVDVNALDIDGKTALHHACGNLYNSLAETLIEAGAKVDIRDKKRRTVLHLIASAAPLFKNRDVSSLVKLCVENGAIRVINGKDRSSNTPLVVAIKGGKENVAMALVECGAEVSSFDHSQVYFEETKRCPCRRHELNLRVTLLNIAARCENLPVVETVLDFGRNVDVNQASESFIDSPIYFSTRNRDTRIARCLLEAKFEYDKYPCNASILHTVVCSGNYSLTNLLLDYGADVDEMDQWTHRTALDSARERLFLGTCELLMMYQFRHPFMLLNDDNPIIKDFRSRCNQELALMKREVVCKDLTLYDLWTRKLDGRIFERLRNENLWVFLSNFERTPLKSKYPLYRDILRLRFRLLVDTKVVYDRATLSLNVFLNRYFRPFPLELVEKMLSYYSIRELKRMTSSMSSLTRDVKALTSSHPDNVQIRNLEKLANSFEVSMNSL